MHLDIASQSISEQPASQRSPRPLESVLKEGAALGAVLAAYQDGYEVPNSALYEAVQKPLGFTDDDYRRRDAVGEGGAKHCLAKRKVRWFQQTLKRLNLLERVPGKRSVWKLRSAQDKELTPAQAGMTMVGFSTSLGLALWSSCDVFAKISEPIALILTSPPFPLARPRKYGGPSEPEMVDFVCRSLEPMIKNLLPGGSLVVNVSNDVFLPGSPARSLYVERLTLALHDRFSLKLMDRLVYEQPSKPPGPMQWASKTRQQLNVAWEPILWFCPDPLRCFADNRRVLLPHTEKHQKLMARGGESRDAIYSDGAYRIRAGRSFAATTPGRIPRNILTYTQHGAEISQLRTNARALGLPIHGALMPLALAMFLIRFLTREGDLVADGFAGWGTSAAGAEATNRRWLITERMAEYVAGQALRLMHAPGFRSSIPSSKPPISVAAGL